MSQHSIQDGLEPIMRLAPVIPVVVVEDAKDAVELARALVAGGLKAIEITLRTPAALDAIRAVANEVEGAVPGVGTVLTAKHYKLAAKAGAKFAVSPGATRKLLDAAEDADLAPLPGIASASEAMVLIERGYSLAKFFPAEAAGGAPFLASIASPLPQLKFCPTGGISPENAGKYLKLPNVICVGGSWMVKQAAIAAKDWAGITALAAEAAKLKG